MGRLLPKPVERLNCLLPDLPEERRLLEPNPEPVARVLLLVGLRNVFLLRLAVFLTLPVVRSVRRFLTAAGGAL